MLVARSQTNLHPLGKQKKKMKLDDNHFVQRRYETISILEDLGQ
jgi:hypothetical protein